MALFGCVVHGGVGLTRGFTVPGTVFTNNGAEVWMARGFSVSGTGFHSRTEELFFKNLSSTYGNPRLYSIFITNANFLHDN